MAPNGTATAPPNSQWERIPAEESVSGRWSPAQPSPVRCLLRTRLLLGSGDSAANRVSACVELRFQEQVQTQDK